MGLNAYFTFTVVKGVGIHWEVVLGAVFLPGVQLITASLFKVHEALFEATREQLKYSIATGPLSASSAMP